MRAEPEEPTPRPLEVRRAAAAPALEPAVSTGVHALRDLAQRRGFELQGDDQLLELLSACEADPAVPEPLLGAVSGLISFLIELEENEPGLPPSTPPG